MSHVFVWPEGIRPSLTPPYDGPFKVLSRTEKTFTIELNGREEVVAIDRVKAAYLATSPAVCAFDHFTTAETKDLADRPTPKAVS